MQRYNIRDNRSTSAVKPRILDLIVNDDGVPELEVKDGKVRKTILLDDFERQVKEVRNLKL